MLFWLPITPGDTDLAVNDSRDVVLAAHDCGDGILAAHDARDAVLAAMTLVLVLPTAASALFLPQRQTVNKKKRKSEKLLTAAS